MAALLKVKVEHADGETATYPVLPVTIVGFERKFHMGWTAVQNDLHMEYVYWLGWDAEHKSGRVVKPFDEWLESIVSVEAEGDAAPLEDGPLPASSRGWRWRLVSHQWICSILIYRQVSSI